MQIYISKGWPVTPSGKPLLGEQVPFVPGVEIRFDNAEVLPGSALSWPLELLDQVDLGRHRQPGPWEWVDDCLSALEQRFPDACDTDRLATVRHQLLDECAAGELYVPVIIRRGFTEFSVSRTLLVVPQPGDARVLVHDVRGGFMRWTLDSAASQESLDHLLGASEFDVGRQIFDQDRMTGVALERHVNEERLDATARRLAERIAELLQLPGADVVQTILGSSLIQPLKAMRHEVIAEFLGIDVAFVRLANSLGLDDLGDLLALSGVENEDAASRRLEAMKGMPFLRDVARRVACNLPWKGQLWLEKLIYEVDAGRSPIEFLRRELDLPRWCAKALVQLPWRIAVAGAGDEEGRLPVLELLLAVGPSHCPQSFAEWEFVERILGWRKTCQGKRRRQLERAMLRPAWRRDWPGVAERPVGMKGLERFEIWLQRVTMFATAHGGSGLEACDLYPDPDLLQLLRMREDYLRATDRERFRSRPVLMDVPAQWPALLVREHNLEFGNLVCLRSVSELQDESRSMLHCVATYSLKCLAGRSHILSLRQGDERVATIEIVPAMAKSDPGSCAWQINSARGPGNECLPPEMMHGLTDFVASLDGENAGIVNPEVRSHVYLDGHEYVELERAQRMSDEAHRYDPRWLMDMVNAGLLVELPRFRHALSPARSSSALYRVLKEIAQRRIDELRSARSAA